MRLTKVVTLGSTLVAFAAHAWLLAPQHPWLWWVVAGVFAISFVVSRASLTLGLVGPLVLAYTAPVVLMLSTGSLDYSLIVVWLALLAGPIFAASDWRAWHTPHWWMPALAGWAFVLAITWPVIALREIDFSVIAARTLNTPNGLFAPAPPISAASVVLAALAQLLGLLWLDFLWARFGTARLPKAERVVLIPLVVSVVLASAVGIWQKWIDIEWLSVPPWSELGRATGTMLDGNSFGTAAAIWAPLMLALTGRREWPAMVGVGIATLIAAGMWASGSRTALLVLSVGIASVAVALLRGEGRSLPKFRWIALLAGAVIALLVVAAPRVDQASPLARMLPMMPSSIDSGVALARDLWNRGGYGLVAMRMTADHPWTGVGVGTFPLLAADLGAVIFSMNLVGDNAQNWWRHQVAELGILGALPAIAVSVGVLSMLLIGTPPARDRTAVTVVRGAVVGVGLASLVGVGTQHPALFVTFVTAVFWLGALLDSPPAPPVPRTVWWAVIALAMLVATGQSYNATRDLRVPHRALVHNFTYGYGFSDPQPDPQYGQIRTAAAHAVGVIPAEHAYFHLTLIAPHATGDGPVRIRLWRAGNLVLDQRVSEPEPVERYLALAQGTRQLMIELDVSRAADDGTALQVASEWLRELPAGTDPALVSPP